MILFSLKSFGVSKLLCNSEETYSNLSPFIDYIAILVVRFFFFLWWHITWKVLSPGKKKTHMQSLVSVLCLLENPAFPLYNVTLHESTFRECGL